MFLNSFEISNKLVNQLYNVYNFKTVGLSTYLRNKICICNVKRFNLLSCAAYFITLEKETYRLKIWTNCENIGETFFVKMYKESLCGVVK